jgi:hypothetical protein
LQLSSKSLASLSAAWTGKKNGELLRLAEQEFDVFVTMDKNLEHQQNLGALNMAVIVLRARSNAYSVVAPLIPRVNEVLRVIQSGQAMHIGG